MTQSTSPTSSTRPPRLVVAIGASAGGLEACKAFLAEMPPKSGMAFIVVMHLDPSHESHMAEIFGHTTEMPVVQVAGDEVLEPDRVYVIAPDSTLAIRNGVISASKAEDRLGKRKPIDGLFSSLAEDQNERAVAIVLSGLGNDGSAGMRNVRDAGGLCIAQDPETAQYDAMPRNAIATGSAEHVLSPERIPAALLDFAGHPERAGSAAEQAQATEALGGILETLASKYGLAFSAYKKATLRRRTERRMGLKRMTDWHDYLEIVRRDPEEAAALYRDLLIGVTCFFRDPEAWAWFEQEIVPQILDRRGTDVPLRIWVPSCATGEEAYTLGIVMLEGLAAARLSTKVQIYATDVNEEAVSRARRGVYPASIANDVSPERLRRFFRKEGETFQVASEVRDSVTFAVHNLLTDPPFSKLALVSCRNLLIYLEPEAQARLLELFHFALRPDGLLLLGGSETIGRHTDLFEPLSKKHRIFRANGATGADRYRVPRWLEHRVTSDPPARAVPHGGSKAARMVEQFVLERCTPACVVINRSLEVLYLFGPTHHYLAQQVGEMRLSLLSWVRPGMYPKLKAGLEAALASKQPATISDMRIERDGASVRVESAVRPITGTAETDGLFLVVFRDVPVSPPDEMPATAGDAHVPLLRELEAELKEARLELRSVVEQLDGANEEYRASNEELVSLNEELQSGNEELESSKEELQSLNEEIIASNRQLQERNAELDVLNADLANFLASTEVPTIFLDREFRIRRFTPAATDVMRLVASDVGRPIVHVKERLRDDRLLDDIERVIEKLVPVSAELSTEDGRWYSRRILPYRTLDDRIDGVSITFVEITEQKRAASEINEARLFAEAIVEAVRTPLLVLDADLRIVSANQCFLETFRLAGTEVEGTKLYDLDGRHWDVPRLRVLLGEVLPESKEITGYLVEHEFGALGNRALLLNARRMPRATRGPLILLAIEDVTHRYDSERAARRRAEELAEEHHRKDAFLAMLGHELRNPLAALTHGIAFLEKASSDSERMTELRAMMERQALRIKTLLDELLDAARVVSGKIEISRVRIDLTDVIRRAVVTMTPFIEAHEHRIVLELPAETGVWVLGDETRLAQVVENLLTNAAKYTEPGGEIRVVLETSAEEARVSVRDTGVGIDAQFLPHLFDLFAQSPHHVSRSEGGLGLGLPLVRRLVEIHGGHVDASSAGRGQGSEFVVTLPRISGRRSTEAPDPRVEQRTRKILVVDDDEDITEVLAELLRLEGHEVVAVNDGPAALEALSAFQPDVVLLDLGLPRMDGYEVARQIRERQGHAILLVALTGYHKDTARLEQAGFDEHLIKPPSLASISGLLSGRTLREAGVTPAPAGQGGMNVAD